MPDTGSPKRTQSNERLQPSARRSRVGTHGRAWSHRLECSHGNYKVSIIGQSYSIDLAYTVYFDVLPLYLNTSILLSHCILNSNMKVTPSYCILNSNCISMYHETGIVMEYCDTSLAKYIQASDGQAVNWAECARYLMDGAAGLFD